MCQWVPLLDLCYPPFWGTQKTPETLSSCNSERTMCFRRNWYSVRKASIGRFVVQWWLYSKLKSFRAVNRSFGSTRQSRVNLVRTCVACKNFPILEIRSLMGMDSSGHLWDMASSETLKAIVCLDFILLQWVGRCPAGRPEHCYLLAMTQRSSNLHKNLNRYF